MQSVVLQHIEITVHKADCTIVVPAGSSTRGSAIIGTCRSPKIMFSMIRKDPRGLAGLDLSSLAGSKSISVRNRNDN